MNWIVEWRDDALDALTEAYLVAPDPAAVTAASHRIEHSLRANPFAATREVSVGLRAATWPPIRVYYEVDLVARTVTVTGLSLLS